MKICKQKFELDFTEREKIFIGWRFVWFEFIWVNLAQDFYYIVIRYMQYTFVLLSKYHNRIFYSKYYMISRTFNPVSWEIRRYIILILKIISKAYRHRLISLCWSHHYSLFIHDIIKKRFIATQLLKYCAVNILIFQYKYFPFQFCVRW